MAINALVNVEQRRPNNSRISVRPTLEGIGYFIVTFCLLGSSFIQRVNLLVLMFGLLAALAFLSYRQAKRNIRRVRASRVLPPEVFAGQKATVGIEATTTDRRRSALAVIFEDQLNDGIVRDLQVFFPTIAPRTTARSKYEIVRPVRGRYRLGPASLISRFPLSLFKARISLSDSNDEIVIYPALGEMTEEWRRATGASSDASQRFRPVPDISQEEFHGVREFRDGDNPRHIHWRTTARRGQLVVKEFEALSARDVVLIVDPSITDQQSQSLAERALSFVATALVDLCQRNASLGGRISLLIAQSETSRIRGTASRRFLSESLTALAEARWNVQANWPDMINSLNHEMISRARVWLILTHPNPAAEGLLSQRLGQRGMSSVTVVDVSSQQYRKYFCEIDDQTRIHE